MRRRITTIHLIAVVITLAISSAVFAQDNKTISEGQRLKVEGIVTERLDDVFTLRGPNGSETAVVLTDHSLSDRRASAVMDYLVTKHNVPLQRLVQPFGYGSQKPIETNHTSQGRAQNRRVEINILVSKGVSQASL